MNVGDSFDREIFTPPSILVEFHNCPVKIKVCMMKRADFRLAEDPQITEDDLLARCCRDESGHALGWTRADIDKLPVHRWQQLMQAFNTLHGEPE